MLIDRSIVAEVDARWRSYGGHRMAPRDLTTVAVAGRGTAAQASEGFWARRGLKPTPDGRAFMKVPPARPVPVEGLSLPPDSRAERILGSSDLIEVVFLQVALAVARTVGRVRVNGPSGTLVGYGTGFMVSPQLLLTNNHVLGASDTARVSVVEFGYETHIGDGAARAGQIFRLEPNRFYLTDPTLDFALVAVSPTSLDGVPLARFGFNKLIDDDQNLIAEGQYSNIIQHPSGQPKQFAFRENEVIGKPGNFLHYRTDTAPGSSGAPVFNDQWQVVALHRAGVWATNAAGQILAVDGQVWREDMGEDRIRWIANEGVRVPRLLAYWRAQTLDAVRKACLDELLTAEPPALTEGLDASARPPGAAGSASLPTPSGLTFASGAAAVDSEGNASWTIPLRVSVSLGSLKPEPKAAGVIDAPGVDRAVPVLDAAVAPDLETVLMRARTTLMEGRTDVIGVRAGWVFDDNGITDRRALVVTVRRKQSPAELAAGAVTELPAVFMGYPVEVMGPTVTDLVRLAVGPNRVEGILAPALSPNEITYRPPPGLVLDPVSDDMRVIAHASPDAGWPTLKTFIKDTQRRLVGAMYEFEAEHVREALTAAGRKRGFEKLTLVLDSARGSINNPATVRDSDAMVRDMKAALGDRLETAWVKLGAVNGWVNRAYHIKVLVRDEAAFWLSSGNWKDSGQPDADPNGNDALLRQLLRDKNREWHAIIEHPVLAQVYQTAILGDFAANRDVRPEELAELPELWARPAVAPLAAERLGQVQYFGPLDRTRRFTIQPILTPDNYLDVVVPAVKTAERSILLQNQTLDAPTASADPRFREFWDTVLRKQQAGLDVRLIFRIQDQDPAGAREDLEALKDFHLDPARIKVQKGCHTKGIIIDGVRIVLGSHNLSNMGATTNRDASLLFEDGELASYFGGIFEHDWANVAERLTSRHWRNSELRTGGAGAADEGFVPFDWKSWIATR